MTCDLCQAKGGVYDFTRACCRARYVLAVISVDGKRSWMDYWQKNLAPDQFRATVQEIRRWLSPSNSDTTPPAQS